MLTGVIVLDRRERSTHRLSQFLAHGPGPPWRRPSSSAADNRTGWVRLPQRGFSGWSEVRGRRPRLQDGGYEGRRRRWTTKFRRSCRPLERLSADKAPSVLGVQLIGVPGRDRRHSSGRDARPDAQEIPRALKANQLRCASRDVRGSARGCGLHGQLPVSLIAALHEATSHWNRSRHAPESQVVPAVSVWRAGVCAFGPLAQRV